MKLPPCAHWRVWEGDEVEGLDEIGCATLFVRNATLDELAALAKPYKRVWFTKEFNTWYIVKGMLEAGKTVAIEATPATLRDIPAFVRKHAVIYLKLGERAFDGKLTHNKLIVGGEAFPTDEIDYVCHGPPFREACLKVTGRGLVKGATVHPELYLHDRRLL